MGECTMQAKQPLYIILVCIYHFFLSSADTTQKSTRTYTRKVPLVIKTYANRGQVKVFEAVHLHTVDSITKDKFTKRIKYQFKKKLPWVMAAALVKEKNGDYGRDYFDAHKLNRWIMDGNFFIKPGHLRHPQNHLPILSVDYYALEHEKPHNFHFIGDLEQIKRDASGTSFIVQFLKMTTNDIQAMGEVATCYKEQGNIDKAEYWLRRAIKANNVNAMNDLGVLLYEEKDSVDQAKTCWMKAAFLGSAEARFNLGQAYEDENNKDKALHWYVQAAELNHIKAKWRVAYLYRKKENYEAASWYAQEAAYDGLVEAMNEFGIIYDLQGKSDEAIKWFDKAAQKGHVIAMRNLGYQYEMEKKYIQAEYWYKKAAEEDLIVAVYDLAHLFFIQGDNVRAEKWHREAIKKYNYVLSAHDLGLMYEKKEEYDKALELYLQASEKGFVFTMLQILFLYNKGKITDITTLEKINEYRDTCKSEIEKIEHFKKVYPDRWKVIKKLIDTEHGEKTEHSGQSAKTKKPVAKKETPES